VSCESGASDRVELGKTVFEKLVVVKLEARVQDNEEIRSICST
jgi:hypothetical protein